MTLAPIVREIVVPAPPDVAYAGWTERIGEWWPLPSHSVFEHDNAVAFVDDEIVETSATGETATWGRVIQADPPGRLVLTWHPGRGPESASTVAVDFVAVDDGRTLIRLTHSGWEVFAEPSTAGEDYGQGWPIVLAAYGRRLDS